jgi:hypothetical protein
MLCNNLVLIPCVYTKQHYAVEHKMILVNITKVR